ncbi:MAG: hypothetical protein DRJ05_07190 [Bacteroidetes bacterium]|nr:MAG: hypothetical protein DRJ05_07190 [Bacteroidota bacterium]
MDNTKTSFNFTGLKKMKNIWGKGGCFFGSRRIYYYKPGSQKGQMGKMGRCTGSGNEKWKPLTGKSTPLTGLFWDCRFV